MKIFRLIEGITITFLGFAFLGLLIWQGWQAYQVESSFSLLAKNVNDTSILSFLVAVLVTAFGLDLLGQLRAGGLPQRGGIDQIDVPGNQRRKGALRLLTGVLPHQFHVIVRHSPYKCTPNWKGDNFLAWRNCW